MSMKFRAHDTFFIRKGWLSKGMRNVIAHDDVFVTKDKNRYPTDELGIGSNMVKALRYWLQAVGLTTEPKTGRRVQSLTELGKVIYENDPYFEELGTLWLLQYHLFKGAMEKRLYPFPCITNNLSRSHCLAIISTSYTFPIGSVKLIHSCVNALWFRKRGCRIVKICHLLYL